MMLVKLIYLLGLMFQRLTLTTDVGFYRMIINFPFFFLIVSNISEKYQDWIIRKSALLRKTKPLLPSVKQYMGNIACVSLLFLCDSVKKAKLKNKTVALKVII